LPYEEIRDKKKKKAGIWGKGGEKRDKKKKGKGG